MNTREWDEGHDAYVAGLSRESCPYLDPRRRSEWLAGHEQARMNKNGC